MTWIMLVLGVAVAWKNSAILGAAAFLVAALVSYPLYRAAVRLQKLYFMERDYYAGKPGAENPFEDW